MPSHYQKGHIISNGIIVLSTNAIECQLRITYLVIALAHPSIWLIRLVFEPCISVVLQAPIEHVESGKLAFQKSPFAKDEVGLGVFGMSTTMQGGLLCEVEVELSAEFMCETCVGIFFTVT
jgi:hypothetical protein